MYGQDYETELPTGGTKIEKARRKDFRDTITQLSSYATDNVREGIGQLDEILRTLKIEKMRPSLTRVIEVLSERGKYSKQIHGSVMLFGIMAFALSILIFTRPICISKKNLHIILGQHLPTVLDAAIQREQSK